MKSTLSNQREDFKKKMEEDREALQRRIDIEKELKDRDEKMQNIPSRKQMREKKLDISRKQQQQHQQQQQLLQQQQQFQIDQSLPFQPENDLDNFVIQTYLSRNKHTLELPDVTFTKGKKEGSYFIGQRRINLDYIDSEVVVIQGNNFKPFQPYLEKQERVEGLKLKALNSAGGLLSLV